MVYYVYGCTYKITTNQEDDVMIDIVTGVAAGYGSKKTVDILEGADTTEQTLREIHDTLIAMHTLMIGESEGEFKDVFQVIPLYKQGLGNNWAYDTQNRTYCRLFTGVAIVLNINCVLGTFTLSPTPGTWIPFDLPDRSIVMLDSTNTNNTNSIYLRYTNEKP